MKEKVLDNLLSPVSAATFWGMVVVLCGVIVFPNIFPLGLCLMEFGLFLMGLPLHYKHVKIMIGCTLSLLAISSFGAFNLSMFFNGLAVLCILAAYLIIQNKYSLNVRQPHWVELARRCGTP